MLFRSEGGDGGDLGRVFVGELGVESVERDGFFVGLDEFDDFVGFGFNSLFVADVGDGDGVEVLVVFGDDS